MPEIEFRDGKRNVPDHVEELMRGLDTYKLTYDQAVKAMNQGLQGRFIERRHNEIVSKHFRDQGG